MAKISLSYTKNAKTKTADHTKTNTIGNNASYMERSIMTIAAIQRNATWKGTKAQMVGALKEKDDYQKWLILAMHGNYDVSDDDYERFKKHISPVLHNATSSKFDNFSVGLFRAFISALPRIIIQRRRIDSEWVGDLYSMIEDFKVLCDAVIKAQTSMDFIPTNSNSVPYESCFSYAIGVYVLAQLKDMDAVDSIQEDDDEDDDEVEEGME